MEAKRTAKTASAITMATRSMRDTFLRGDHAGMKISGVDITIS